MDRAEYLRLTCRAQGGDQAALDILCRELAVRLGTIVKHKLWWWSPADQDDVLQGALMLFAEKFHEVAENPCAYAVQILHYCIGNEIQKRRRQQRRIAGIDTNDREDDFSGNASLSAQNFLVSDDDPARSVESREELEIVIRAIDRLKPFCQIVFKGMIEELSMGEIWQSVNGVEPRLTLPTFYKRVFDCRKKLRHLLSVSN